MNHQTSLWLTMVLAICAGTARADEDRALRTFQRIGATIERDETRPGRPVVAVWFGTDTKTDESWERYSDLVLPDTAAKVTDQDVKELPAFPFLEKLDLCSSQVTDDGLKELAALKNLQVLDLRKTKISDSGLQVLQQLKKLKRLYLTGCTVSDAALVHLRDLADLEVLSLGRTNVTGEGLSQLKGLKNLQGLYPIGIKLSRSPIVLRRSVTRTFLVLTVCPAGRSS
jgi:internalin A